MKKLKEIKIITTIYVGQLKDFYPDEQDIILEARKAAERRYAPYSHFMVGAAVQTFAGKIIPGTNQENISFRLTNCAEATTIQSAFNAGCGRINKIAATGKPEGKKWNIGKMPISPCGACRQDMVEAEYRSRQTWIILLDGFYDGRIYRIEGAKSLLPYPFSPGLVKLN